MLADRERADFVCRVFALGPLILALGGPEGVAAASESIVLAGRWWR
jgi:hypothetical protein